MASIIATLTARKGQEEQLARILCRLLVATASEPGAISYDIHSPIDNPAVFIVAERYRDEAAMKAHAGSEYLKAALAEAGPLLAVPAEVRLTRSVASIRRNVVPVQGKQVEVNVLPLGPANLVYAKTDRGLLACGAIDPAALARFDLPAARVKPRGQSVTNLDDLLAGEVREANAPAQALGIQAGMTGAEALARL